MSLANTERVPWERETKKTGIEDTGTRQTRRIVTKGNTERVPWECKTKKGGIEISLLHGTRSVKM